MIPDYCEAITGYRCWNVFPNGLMVGQAHAEPWPPFEPFVGRCGFAASPDHIRDGRFMPAPVRACDCGVHALKDAKGAAQRLIDEVLTARNAFGFYLSYYNYTPPKGRVWGAVKLWGRVVEHEIGYRAEFAYPSALYCQDPALAPIVSALYGVSCEVQTLDIPAAEKRDEDDATSWYLKSWYSGITSTPPARVQQPGLIQSASLAQIASVGASSWQKRQATAPPQKDWRAIMSKAFHVKKNDSALSDVQA